jgi:hypothetical protein
MSSRADSLASRLATADWDTFVRAVNNAWSVRGYDTTFIERTDTAAVFELTQTDSGLRLHRLCIAAQADPQTPLEQSQFEEYLEWAISVADGRAIEFITTSPIEADPNNWPGDLPVTVYSGDTLTALFEPNTARAESTSTAEAVLRTEDGTPAETTSSANHSAAHDETTVSASRASSMTGQSAQQEASAKSHTRTATQESGLFDITVTEEPYVQLPNVLAVDARRRTIAGLASVIALVLIWNPTGSIVPVEVLGTLLGLGAIGILRYPESMWAALTRERARLGTCDTGEIRRLGETIQYVPENGTTWEFGTAASPIATQQAVVFGALDAMVEMPLQRTAQGTIPTPIATDGARSVAAYRVAAHGTSPRTAADECGIDRTTLESYVESLVRQYIQQ